MGSSETAYGKAVSELQSDVQINGTEITGTLNYVTGYTQFSGDVGKQSGNYLALDFSADPWPDLVEVELLNANTTGAIELSEDDHIGVFRITNKESQAIKVTTLSGDDDNTVTYGLSGLTLKPES